MHTLAIINQKGGVGKTTTTANLAHALVLESKRVAVVDLDPQAHLGASLGIDTQLVDGVDKVISGGASVSELSLASRSGLDILPAGSGLSALENNGFSGANGSLRSSIRDAHGDKDFVLIDCPPSNGLLARCGLMAADGALVPVAGDYLSLCGLSHLIKFFSDVAANTGTRAAGHRIVLTRFHTRRRLPREVSQTLTRHFPGKVLATPIRETAALAECPSFGKTIFEYRRRSNGAADYQSLALDLLNGRTL